MEMTVSDDYLSTCHEGVTRRGEYQPCAKPSVAMRNDPETGDPYPVCSYHARGDMVPLVDVLEGNRKTVLDDLPTAVVVITASHVCPECQQGKCRNCTGWALDADDNMVDCGCTHDGR